MKRIVLLVIAAGCLSLVVSCTQRQESERTAEQNVVVRIDDNDRVYLNEEAVEIAQLAARVSDASIAMGVETVLLRADRRARYSTVATVVDRLKAVDRLRINVQ